MKKKNSNRDKIILTCISVIVKSWYSMNSLNLNAMNQWIPLKVFHNFPKFDFMYKASFMYFFSLKSKIFYQMI